MYSSIQRALETSDEKLAASLARRRIVPLVGKITREIGEEVTKTMVILEAKEVRPITLLISSGGGDVSAAGRIMDIISMLQSPVHGLVFGRAASMAVDILLFCASRSGMPHSEYFVHFTRCGFECISDSDTVTAEDIEALQQKFLGEKKTREKFYAEKLGITAEKVHELFRRGEKFNLDYNAEQAKALGIIQKIETDFKLFETLPVTA